MPAWGSHEVQRIDYLPGGYTNRNYRLEVQDRAYVLRVVEGAKPRLANATTWPSTSPPTSSPTTRATDIF